VIPSFQKRHISTIVRCCFDTIDQRYKNLLRLGLLFAFVPLYGFVHHATADYKTIELHGHPVYLSPEAVSSADLLDRVIAKLNSDLSTIHSVLPRTALTKIANVSFWIEHDNPDVPGLTFHQSSDWLRSHGYNTDKARCIEIGNLEHFLSWHAEQPFIVLHELSHAYQDRVLGNDSPTMRQAYDLAVSSHRYESVPYIRGGKLRAYALDSAAEYFAELSEAYFGKNDFYPFVRSELEEFDHAGFQMIEKLWIVR
jgi:hypothetical protein